jgi:branched-chain amino acid transport system ATP-binding protein
MNPLLEVEGVSLRFANVVALDGVTFSVAPGELFALAGPNGAGKTTLLNCISGVERPAAGRVPFQGIDLSGTPASARAAQLGIARTLQGLGVVDSLDVEANLLLGRHRLGRAGVVSGGLRLPRMRAEEVASLRRVREVAGQLGLEDSLSLPAGSLPAGARKRLELGRALCMEPSLLLLDEPFAGAGPAEIESMTAAIRGGAGVGAGVVVVDHDLDAVLGLASRVIVLDAGPVLANGPPDDVRHHPAVRRVYLGVV